MSIHRAPRRVIFLLLALVASAACTGGGIDGTVTAPAPVLTTLSVSLGSSTLQVSQSTQATASGLDQNNGVIGVGAVTWSSSSPSVAAISTSGAISALAPGQTTITGASQGKQGTATLTVQLAPATADFAITDAQFTQGVQVVDGSLPMVLEGNAAVVNVLVRASTAASKRMQIVLRLFDANGALVRIDTALTVGALGTTPSFEAPSAQFLVPAAVLRSGLTWQVIRDPKRESPDDSVANDAFPRAGAIALATVTVPPLNIRFVPIVLASHGNAIGAVTTATIPQYLRTLLSVHPLGVVNALVGTPLTTTASFGTAPSGGTAPFWQQVLAELDLARVADPVASTANWFGVVVPPAGFNNTSFGGFSYIPTSATNSGAGTRTSVGMQINWFNRPTQARDLVAHEIGHTFGRLHAPCGGAGSPLDPSYPVATGTLDQSGHDVFAWANGLATSAATVDKGFGDAMGYCFPAWSSAYTYRAVLAFRGLIAASALAVDLPRVRSAPAARRRRALVVRGSVTNGNQLHIEPAFTIDARPSLPDGAGSYRVEGLDADGRVLFAHTFEPFVLAHMPEVRPFTVVLPSDAALDAQLVTIVVRGPAGIQRMRRLPMAGVAPLARVTQAVREGNGVVNVACADASARGILVLDAPTGTVLGSAPAASLRVAAASASAVEVVCSDGVGSQRTRVDVR